MNAELAQYESAAHQPVVSTGKLEALKRKVEADIKSYRGRGRYALLLRRISTSGPLASEARSGRCARG